MVQTTKTRRFSLKTALVAMLMVVLAACGDPTATTSTGVATTAPAAATTAPVAATTAPVAAATTAPVAAATTAPVAVATTAGTMMAGTTTGTMMAGTTTGTMMAGTTTGTMMAGTPGTMMAGTTAATTPSSTGQSADSAAIEKKLIGTFTPDKNGKTGGTVVYSFAGQDFDTLNFYYNTSSSALTVIEQFYENLVGINSDSQYYPDLITEIPTLGNGGVKIVGSGQDVTLKFKPGLLWSDGEKLTSKDLAFTIKWLQNPDNSNIQAVDTDSIANISSVDTPDDTTAIIHMKKTYGPYINLLSGIPPLPEHTWTKIAVNADTIKDKESVQPTVVSGPFKPTEVVAGQKVVLSRNDNFKPVWGQNAYLDKIIFQVTSDTTVATASLLKNEIDALEYVQEPDLAQLQGKPSVTLVVGPNYGYEHLLLNMDSPILKDAAVRHAINVAIDRNALITATATDKNSLLATSTNPLSFAYDASLQPPKQNVDEAKKTLEDAGWKAGSDGVRAKDGTKLSISISTTSGNKRREQLEQILQVYLKNVGIELKVQNYKSSQLFGSYSAGGPLAQGKYDIGMYTSSSGPDPDADYGVFHSSGIPTEANKYNGSNWNRLKDPIIDKALDAQRLEVDFGKRVTLWKTYQAQFAKVESDLPLYTRIWAAAYNPKLKNYKNNPTSVANEWNTVEWYLTQ